MKFLGLVLAGALALYSTAQAGCLTGAVVDGIGGHFADHPVPGAVGGCVFGQHLVVQKKRPQPLMRQQITTTVVKRR